MAYIIAPVEFTTRLESVLEKVVIKIGNENIRHQLDAI
ncbi:hypothetical protein GXM_07156 [Nostoc sphaeroides CCNUC1]|uniref:Uncharacterized protein n=1 Tax=Nostoc sphaeroides CCNUC1 TaxID=2653204 RepID=A0A5P8WAP8_9NOSO|nr:hypothetical protein GXM_07156 [Nostoc sphaeroides CCNUC1]